MTAEQYAMPFGAVSSVYAWDRIGELIAKVASVLLKTAVCRWSSLPLKRRMGKHMCPKH